MPTKVVRTAEVRSPVVEVRSPMVEVQSPAAEVRGSDDWAAEGATGGRPRRHGRIPRVATGPPGVPAIRGFLEVRGWHMHASERTHGRFVDGVVDGSWKGRGRVVEGSGVVEGSWKVVEGSYAAREGGGEGGDAGRRRSSSTSQMGWWSLPGLGLG